MSKNTNTVPTNVASLSATQVAWLEANDIEAYNCPGNGIEFEGSLQDFVIFKNGVASVNYRPRDEDGEYGQSICDADNLSLNAALKMMIAERQL